LHGAVLLDAADAVLRPALKVSVFCSSAGSGPTTATPLAAAISLIWPMPISMSPAATSFNPSGAPGRSCVFSFIASAISSRSNTRAV